MVRCSKTERSVVPVSLGRIESQTIATRLSGGEISSIVIGGAVAGRIHSLWRSSLPIFSVSRRTAQLAQVDSDAPTGPGVLALVHAGASRYVPAAPRLRCAAWQLIFKPEHRLVSSITRSPHSHDTPANIRTAIAQIAALQREHPEFRTRNTVALQHPGQQAKQTTSAPRVIATKPPSCFSRSSVSSTRTSSA